MSKKRGSKQLAECPFCGKVLTKAGLSGHLRFKHGRDPKAPLFSKAPPKKLIGAEDEAKLAKLNEVLDKAEATYQSEQYKLRDIELALAKVLKCSPKEASDKLTVHILAKVFERG